MTRDVVSAGTLSRRLPQMVTNPELNEVCIAHGGNLGEPSGGTDRVTALAIGLQERGYEVTIIAPEIRGDPPTALNNVTVRTIPSVGYSTVTQPLRAALVAWTARKHAADESTVLQLEHSPLAGVAALLGASNYLLDMHDLVYPSPQYDTLPLAGGWRRAIRGLEKLGVRRAAHIVVVSSPMQEVLQASWSVNAADITVIPNGFDPASISRLSADREVDGRVGFIGTLHSKLNIDSFRSIGELGCVESVQVIGDGPRMDDLKALVKRQSDSKIELHGYLPNKEAYELLSTCQVAIYPVLPSEHTRMLSSRKIFDYAALGKAMVLDDVSDSDLWARFDDQDAAVFAEPDAPDAFANDVERLLTNAEARHEIAAQAEELAAEYTWAAHSHTLADIYDNWASWGR